MTRLRRILHDDIESFDLRSLIVTAVVLTLCLVGVTLVQGEQFREGYSSKLVQEPAIAR